MSQGAERGKGRGRRLEAKADLSLTYCGIFIFFPAVDVHVARQIRQASRPKIKKKRKNYEQIILPFDRVDEYPKWSKGVEG